MIAGIDSEIDLKSGVYFTLQTIAKSGHIFVCLGKLLFVFRARVLRAIFHNFSSGFQLSGGAQRTICGAGNQTQVSSMQGKSFNHYTIFLWSPKIFLNESFIDII